MNSSDRIVRESPMPSRVAVRTLCDRPLKNLNLKLKTTNMATSPFPAKGLPVI